MKTKILLLFVSVFCFSISAKAQSYPVTLKIIDETKTLSNGNAPGENVIVSVSPELAEQNPRTPAGDWWFPMYADAGVTPKGLYTSNTNDITWEITFNAAPGDYVWIPFMKSLGWKFLNNAYMYSSDIDNPEISFSVKDGGVIEGTIVIVIPATQPKHQFSIEVVDLTMGALTNEVGTDNEDKNIYTWVSGGVSQSQDWWTALYFDTQYGPTSELIKDQDRWTWKATFEGPAGVYEWNPSIKSWGWKTLNKNVGDADWEGDNLKFIVGPDGTVTGDNVLTINEKSETYNLTLNLFMGDTPVDPAGMHVAGTFNEWNTSSHQLTDDNADGIYSITIEVQPNNEPQQYKFINGNEWGKEETVFGNCAYRSNRLVWVTDQDVTVEPVVLGYCGNTAGIDAVKVACIGDSNTEGAGVWPEADRLYKSWPVQMRDFLGNDYYTDNLGVSGATLMNIPAPWGAWTNNAQYNYNKLLNPDIILVALGTNDSKTEAGYWGARDFKADYVNLINDFKTLTSNPEVYMVTPIKAFANGYAISDDNIRNGVIPAINELSKEYMIPVIDWYSITSSLSQGEYIPDGVHANDVTLRMMAKKASDILLISKPIISTSQQESVTYYEYRWYLNGQLIDGANAATYTTSQDGVYNVAIKPFEGTDDVIISAPYTLSGGGSSTELKITASTTGINPELEGENANIYCNSGNLVVTGCENTDLHIFNASGILVKKVYVSEISAVFNINELPSGFYLCKTQKHVAKIIK